MQKVNVKDLLLLIITEEGLVYYEPYKEESLHREALKRGYEYFLKKDKFILPIPFFKGNHATCQMMASSGSVVFMNCSKEGILYTPEDMTKPQTKLLKGFDFSDVKTTELNHLLEETDHVRGRLQ